MDTPKSHANATKYVLSVVNQKTIHMMSAQMRHSVCTAPALTQRPQSNAHSGRRRGKLSGSNMSREFPFLKLGRGLRPGCPLLPLQVLHHMHKLPPRNPQYIEVQTELSFPKNATTPILLPDVTNLTPFHYKNDITSAKSIQTSPSNSLTDLTQSTPDTDKDKEIEFLKTENKTLKEHLNQMNTNLLELRTNFAALQANTLNVKTTPSHASEQNSEDEGAMDTQWNLKRGRDSSPPEQESRSPAAGSPPSKKREAPAAVDISSQDCHSPEPEGESCPGEDGASGWEDVKPKRSPTRPSRPPVRTPPPSARRPLAEAGGASQRRVPESKLERTVPPVSSKNSPSKGGRGPANEKDKKGPANNSKGKSNIKPIHFKR